LVQELILSERKLREVDARASYDMIWRAICPGREWEQRNLLDSEKTALLIERALYDGTKEF